jgi:hypothetical protein
MPVTPFHGARVFQSADDPVFVSLTATAVIGLLSAIPSSALPAGMAFNSPVLIQTPTEAASLPQSVRDDLDSIFDQVLTPVVLVMVNQGSDAAATTAAAVGDATQKTGVHAWTKAASLGLPEPKLLCAPGLTTASAAAGITGVTVDTPGGGYTEATVVSVAGTTGGSGAVLQPVIGAGGAITGITVVKPGYGYTGVLTVTIGGPGVGAAATAVAGTVLNAVIAEAQGVAEQLRAQFYADGPDGTAAQAVSARQLIGSRRVCLSDPKVLKSVNGVPVARPSSPVFAAMQAKADQQSGPHFAGSNMVVNGIQGTNRPIDPRTDANFLNSNGINTIINRGDGFRTWGPRTCAVGTVWEFTPVVRVADLINDSVERAFVQFNDRPQSRLALDQMVMAGRAVLLGLEAEGILLPGSQFGLSTAQTPADGVQGIVKFAMKYEPPAPIYDIRIGAYRNPLIAYELLYDSVAGTVDTGDLL